MIMNNFKSKISLALLLISGAFMSSCSESFLDVSSKTEPNSENYYKTESQALRAQLHGKEQLTAAVKFTTRPYKP